MGVNNIYKLPEAVCCCLQIHFITDDGLHHYVYKGSLTI